MKEKKSTFRVLDIIQMIYKIGFFLSLAIMLVSLFASRTIMFAGKEMNLWFLIGAVLLLSIPFLRILVLSLFYFLNGRVKLLFFSLSTIVMFGLILVINF